MPHTADVRIRASADTPEGLFRAAIKGMCSFILGKTPENKRDKTYEISVQSVDMTAVLIDFLAEALYIINNDGAMISRTEINSLTNTEIFAKLHTYECRDLEEDVKAVTWHEANIKQDNGHFVTNIILDI